MLDLVSRSTPSRVETGRELAMPVHPATGQLIDHCDVCVGAKGSGRVWGE